MPFAPFLYGGFKSMNFHWTLRTILDRILIGPDMMFFIAGFLSMFTWYNPMRKFSISFGKYVLVRYLRCLSVVGIAILGGYIWPRLGSGPYFKELAQHFHKSCSERAWKNLFLINNQDRMLDIVSDTYLVCLAFVCTRCVFAYIYLDNLCSTNCCLIICLHWAIEWLKSFDYSVSPIDDQLSKQFDLLIAFLLPVLVRFADMVLKQWPPAVRPALSGYSLLLDSP